MGEHATIEEKINSCKETRKEKNRIQLMSEKLAPGRLALSILIR